MQREDLIDLIEEVMADHMDMDVTLRHLAEAAADAILPLLPPHPTEE